MRRAWLGRRLPAPRIAAMQERRALAKASTSTVSDGRAAKRGRAL
jgi:hypothetical protein